MASSVVITSDDGTTTQVLYDKTPPSTSTDLTAITNTLAALLGPEAKSSFNADSVPFAIIPSHVAASQIDQSTASYLKELTRVANAAATSVFCGSVLAGHTSEADEFGDVALFLGPGGDPGVDFGPGHERDVVDALGLGHLLESGDSSEHLDLSPSTSLPPTVDIPSPLELGGQMRQLVGELNKFKNTYAFRIPGRLTVYFLVGRSESVGWIGLVGIGVHT